MAVLIGEINIELSPKTSFRLVFIDKNNDCIFIFDLAEDIYTAAGWESKYQNGYLHGSRSRFSAKSAIYTAAGCQHKIAIYTTAVPEQIQIYTRLPCVQIKSLFTWQQFKSQIGYIYCCRVYKKSFFPRQPFKSQIGYIHVGREYIHGCRVGVQVSKWLFTRQPFKILSQIGYIHGCRVST